VGPIRKTLSAPLRKIPAFQRGGSIVPRKMRVRRASSLTHHDPFSLTVALDSKVGRDGKQAIIVVPHRLREIPSLFAQE